MSRATFRLRRSQLTGEFEWAPASEPRVRAWLGWLMLATAYVLLLAISWYLLLWALGEVHPIDFAALPDSGAWLREPVERLFHGQR